MSDFIDITGEKFGRLTAIKRAKNRKRRTFWLCKCECGNNAEIVRSSLINGHSKSCGCLKKEGNNYKHGNSCNGKNTKEYVAWQNTKSRCYNVNDQDYHNYGARGIKVCDRWFNSFENFLEDMGRCPGNNYSIDRIDNNGNYSPSNCRWATSKEQSRNTRKNNYQIYNGRTMIIKDWAKELGVTDSLLCLRLKRGLNFIDIVKKIKEKRILSHWSEDLMQSDYENGVTI